MSQLNGFGFISQSGENTCWIATATMIYNYLFGASLTEEDVIEFVKRNYQYGDITVNQIPCGSAVNLLCDLAINRNQTNLPVGADDKSVLSEGEIENCISNNVPILCCLSGTQPRSQKVNGMYPPNYRTQNGHWVVIIGISDDKRQILIADPGSGAPVTANYNKVTYNGMYWRNATACSRVAFEY